MFFCATTHYLVRIKNAFCWSLVRSMSKILSFFFFFKKQNPLLWIQLSFNSPQLTTQSYISAVTVQQQQQLCVEDVAERVDAPSWLVGEFGWALSSLHDGTFSPVAHGATCQLASCHHTSGAMQCCSTPPRAALPRPLPHFRPLKASTSWLQVVAPLLWEVFNLFKIGAGDQC